MNKRNFKKKFPDVKVQLLKTSGALNSVEVQQKVEYLVSSLNTGLLFYEYDGDVIKIFTSDICKKRQESMCKGCQVLDDNLGLIGTIVSTVPFLRYGRPCIKVNFGGDVATYSCEYFM